MVTAPVGAGATKNHVENLLEGPGGGVQWENVTRLDASTTKPEFVGAQQRIDDAGICRGGRIATEEDLARGARV